MGTIVSLSSAQGKPDLYTNGTKGTNGTIPEFTQLEIEILLRTWNELNASADTIAIDIFLEIFRLRPEVMKFFPFKDKCGEALTAHPYFKGHAKRFMHAVGLAVSNLAAWDLVLIPSLARLGHYHTRIPGFSHDVFELFFTAMNTVWARHLGRTYHGGTKVAWCKVFRFLVSQVEQGYDQGISSACE